MVRSLLFCCWIFHNKDKLTFVLFFLVDFHRQTEFFISALKCTFSIWVSAPTICPFKVAVSGHHSWFQPYASLAAPGESFNNECITQPDLTSPLSCYFIYSCLPVNISCISAFIIHCFESKCRHLSKVRSLASSSTCAVRILPLLAFWETCPCASCWKT